MPFTAPPATAAQIQMERAIVRRINRVRHAHGLARVRLSPGLSRVARRHCSDMLRRDALTHSASDGSSLSARLSRVGRHTWYGEVLAWAPRGGTLGARAIVRMWMHSASHRAVLMNGRMRRVGVGRVFGAMGGQAGHAITADFSS